MNRTYVLTWVLVLSKKPFAGSSTVTALGIRELSFSSPRAFKSVSDRCISFGKGVRQRAPKEYGT